MKISQRGLKLVKEFEGCLKSIGGGKFVPYVCPAGVLTIGWGTTNLDGKKFDKYSVWTQAECDAALATDMGKYEQAVTRRVKVPLNQNQFDALVSFTYNCGEGNLAKSTLLRKVNAGDYDGASRQFAAWNKGAGKVLAGLVRRRAAEAALFRSPVQTPKPKIEQGLPPPPDIEPSEPMPQQVDAPSQDRPSIFEKLSTWISGFGGLSFLAYLTDWRVVTALGALTLAGACAAIWFLGPEHVRAWVRQKVNR
jgi:lysozyme